MPIAQLLCNKNPRGREAWFRNWKTKSGAVKKKVKIPQTQVRAIRGEKTDERSLGLFTGFFSPGSRGEKFFTGQGKEMTQKKPGLKHTDVRTKGQSGEEPILSIINQMKNST